MQSGPGRRVVFLLVLASVLLACFSPVADLQPTAMRAYRTSIVVLATFVLAALVISEAALARAAVGPPLRRSVKRTPLPEEMLAVTCVWLC